MNLTGTLRFVDLGPGQWVLETATGKVALFGDIKDDLANREVRVAGSAIDGHSASMVEGKAVMVKSIRAT